MISKLLVAGNISFGTEIPVSISAYSLDAMEPALSADGNTLFFNSLNNGTDTDLYFATKVNDSSFVYQGALSGANQTVNPRLDAVASIDTASQFYWVSTRDYPSEFDNLHVGYFNGTDVEDAKRVRGDFYIYQAGWLIMDASISENGKQLIFCNAYFNDCAPLPCKAKLGIAAKVNDSTFNKLSTSDSLLAQVNDSNYLVYAPHLLANGLELYFTRILKTDLTHTEICVAQRASVSEAFGSATVLISSTEVAEAATLSSDGTKLYYHKKVNGSYQLFLRYRNSTTAIAETKTDAQILPQNPINETLYLNAQLLEQGFRAEIYSLNGQCVKRFENQTEVDISKLNKGIYLLKITQATGSWEVKFIKQ